MRNIPLQHSLGAAFAALAVALAVPAATRAQEPSVRASCNGTMSSLTAHAQTRDDVSYFVHLGAQMGVRDTSGAFFSFYAQQHAGSPDACVAIPEP